MATTPLPSELPALIDRALQMTEERLADAPAGSIHGMYSSIQNQLRFMRDTIAAGKLASIEDKNRLTLHVIAVRELDTTDPEYSGALCNAAYLFKQRLPAAVSRVASRSGLQCATSAATELPTGLVRTARGSRRRTSWR